LHDTPVNISKAIIGSIAGKKVYLFTIKHPPANVCRLVAMVLCL
jgi:hypothetical protein